MIERPFHSHFFTAPGTGHWREWFCVGCIGRRAAGRACLGHRGFSSTAIETHCNIQKLQSNEMQRPFENTHEKLNKHPIRRTRK
jgi:hypothetical protein